MNTYTFFQEQNFIFKIVKQFISSGPTIVKRNFGGPETQTINGAFAVGSTSFPPAALRVPKIYSHLTWNGPIKGRNRCRALIAERSCKRPGSVGDTAAWASSIGHASQINWSVRRDFFPQV
jgi:hypothetical protein